MRGIEPPSRAWEALILPLNYIRKSSSRYRVNGRLVNNQRATAARSSRFPSIHEVVEPNPVCDAPVDECAVRVCEFRFRIDGSDYLARIRPNCNAREYR